MEVLGLDNILGEQEIENLFTAPEETAPAKQEQKEQQEDQQEQKEPAKPALKETKKTTEEVNPDELFGGEDQQPESAGQWRQRNFWLALIQGNRIKILL